MIVDILLRVMLHERLIQFTVSLLQTFILFFLPVLFSMAISFFFQPSQVGSLFTFLARQGAKHRSSIKVDGDIYDQVYIHVHV